MIQRERERREQLLGQGLGQRTARRLAKATQREAEQQKRVVESDEMTVKDNIHFLKELKIPEYLQAIIDEEHLTGAYVMWSKKELTGPLLTRVSLVWDIEKIMGASHTTGHEGNTMAGTISTLYSWTEMLGYKFRSVDVMAVAVVKDKTSDYKP